MASSIPINCSELSLVKNSIAQTIRKYMALFEIVVWAIIFLTKLCFLPGISITTGIELLYDDIYYCLRWTCNVLL